MTLFQKAAWEKRTYQKGYWKHNICCCFQTVSVARSFVTSQALRNNHFTDNFSPWGYLTVLVFQVLVQILLIHRCSKLTALFLCGYHWTKPGCRLLDLFDHTQGLAIVTPPPPHPLSRILQGKGSLPNPLKISVFTLVLTQFTSDLCPSQ